MKQKEIRQVKNTDIHKTLLIMKSSPDIAEQLDLSCSEATAEYLPKGNTCKVTKAQNMELLL